MGIEEMEGKADPSPYMDQVCPSSEWAGALCVETRVLGSSFGFVDTCGIVIKAFLSLGLSFPFSKKEAVGLGG